MEKIYRNKNITWTNLRWILLKEGTVKGSLKLCFRLHFQHNKLFTASRDPIPNRPAIHPTVIVLSRRNRSATPTFTACTLESLNFPALRLYPPTVKPPVPTLPPLHKSVFICVYAPE
jgi:hypothetical protein